jgi:hypothetical protein
MTKARNKPRRMKVFLAVYLGTKARMDRWEKLPARVRREREAAGMQAWGEWVARHKGSIVDMGAPLGTTKRIDRKGVRSTSNQLAVYSLVRAPSHAAAARLFRDHPHFAIFPGEAVEVMECLDIPGM